jgi:hypothetical protein
VADPTTFNVEDALTSRAMEYLGPNNVLAGLEDPGPDDVMTMELIKAIQGGASTQEAIAQMFGPELNPGDESLLLSRLPGVYMGLEGENQAGFRPGLEEYLKSSIAGQPLRKYSLNQAGQQLLNNVMQGGGPPAQQPTAVPTAMTAPTATPTAIPGSLPGTIDILEEKRRQEEEARRALDNQ